MAIKVKIDDKFPKDKDWYKSLTINSAVGMILVLIGNTLITNELNPEYILIGLGCIGAIYGRIKANRSVK
jgi:hypothetical protein